MKNSDSNSSSKSLLWNGGALSKDLGDSGDNDDLSWWRLIHNHLFLKSNLKIFELTPLQVELEFKRRNFFNSFTVQFRGQTRFRGRHGSSCTTALPSSQCTTSTTTIKTVHLVWHHPLCSDHDMNRWNMDTEGYFAINNNLIFWKSPDNLNMDKWSISMEKFSYKSLWTIKFLGVICIQATSEATVLSWNFAVYIFPGHFVLSWNPEMQIYSWFGTAGHMSFFAIHQCLIGTPEQKYPESHAAYPGGQFQEKYLSGSSVKPKPTP